MTQKIYIVEGRQFRTEADYKMAKRDKEVIDGLRERATSLNCAGLRQLQKDLESGKYSFYTLLGQDFADELTALIKKTEREETQKNGRKRDPKAFRGTKVSNTAKAYGNRVQPVSDRKDPPGMENLVREELRRRERNRRLLLFVSTAVAVLCLGYVGIYNYFNQRTDGSYEELSALKESAQTQIQSEAQSESGESLYTLDGEAPEREVLEEYKILLNKNKKLIGWLTFDDKTIGGESGFPVMQTSDNEYYLDHNINQEYDKNGTIFMDKDCDAQKPSTNLILYGHHMKSGKMFGNLDKYKEEDYYREHPYIWFDTIYEKGTWQVMYVFRSHVYSEAEIAFKYYQFIDANSEQEFESNMQEMATMALYDTGVTASYGDRLLTLSTCDYQEANGRFVVVAKKVTTKE